MGRTTITLLAPDGRVVCDVCVVAESFAQRFVGLMGRRTFPAGHGCLLRPSWSVHTHFLRFPIDVVFLDRYARIVRIVPRLRPWRAAAARAADAVLQLPAGASERAGLRIGYSLAWGEIREP